MKNSVAVWGCAALVCVAGSALAHHSQSAFERDKVVNLVGTLKEFRWTNPHSWMDIEIPNESGGTAVWSVEMTSPAILARAGWKSNLVKAGDKVNVQVRPLKTGDPGGLFVSITMPNGKVMTQSAPRPAGAAPSGAAPATPAAAPTP
jgi:hypothetical protein